jgi:hypothetical protein
MIEGEFEIKGKMHESPIMPRKIHALQNEKSAQKQPNKSSQV